MGLGGGVQVGQQCAATDPSSLALRIDGDLTKLT